MTKSRIFFTNTIRIAIPLTLTLLWLGFIYGNSLKTGIESGAQSGKVYEIVNSITSLLGFKDPISEHFIRKAAHFTEFAILGILICTDIWSFGFVSLKKRLYISSPILFGSVPVCALFAALDEYLQSFVDGRGPSPKDVLIDTSGALSATILFTAFFVISSILYKKHIVKNTTVNNSVSPQRNV